MWGDDALSTLVISQKPQNHLPWPAVGAGFFPSCNSSGKPLGTEWRDDAHIYSKEEEISNSS
jgi:hypothetical protein